MLFSYKELTRIANLKLTTTIDDVVVALNTIGFEVESVSSFAEIENARFGLIKKVFKNPNGTKLNVCEIAFSDKKRTIQTTAQNVYEGMYVVAFVPGTKANGTTFQAREIRGIVSEGMLTNLSEFGINSELLPAAAINGIYDYNNVSINDDVNETLGLNDKIIEVNILANRADAASYYVMAMEMAAYFKTMPNIPNPREGNIPSTRTVSDSGLAKSLVFVEAKNDFKITAKEQILLAKHQLKSINPGVDIGNLATLYSGMPTHIYDANKVGLHIKTTLSKEKVIALGNKTVKLNNNLVIADENGTIAIASVIGLEATKVELATQSLLIEIGRFPSEELRKSMQVVKIETAAARQGTKGNSAGMIKHALVYLSNKLRHFSNPVNMDRIKVREITFEETQLDAMAGFKLTDNKRYREVISALKTLGFTFSSGRVTVPSYRYDIRLQEDMNEEIMRFYGYGHFRPQPVVHKPLVIRQTKNWNEALQAQGYSEVRTYTLTNDEQNNFNPFAFPTTIKLQTFVSTKRNQIRSSQAIALLEIAQYNHKQGVPSINIFSIGMIHDGVQTIALLSNDKSFYEVQNDVVHLVPGITFQRLIGNDLHPNAAATIIFKQKQVGWIGQVHPRNSLQKYIMAEFMAKAPQAYESGKTVSSKPLQALKFKDINIFVKLREDLETHLVPYKDKYQVRVIDEYKIPGGKKVTIRIYDDK